MDIHTSHDYFKQPAGSLTGLAESAIDEHASAHLELMDNSIGLNKKNLLEIGSSDGSFLAMLSSRGAVVSGIEINEDAVDSIQEPIRSRVANVSVEEWLRDHAQLYDVVVARDVVEHLNSPQPMVEMLCDLSKKWIVITTMNFELGLRIGPEWIGYNSSLEHVAYMGPRYLEKLFAKSGARLVDYWSTVGPGDLKTFKRSHLAIRMVINKLMRFRSTDRSSQDKPLWIRKGTGHRLLMVFEKHENH